MQIAALMSGAGSRLLGCRAQPGNRRVDGDTTMPELPEVETTMRALAARLTGRRLTGLVQRRPDLRFPLPARLGERLRGPDRGSGSRRRAKFIECFLDDGAVLLLHLGMSGRLRVRRRARAARTST